MIKDAVEAKGWSLEEFAVRINRSRDTVHRIFEGRSGVAFDFLLLIARKLGADTDTILGSIALALDVPKAA